MSASRAASTFEHQEATTARPGQVCGQLITRQLGDLRAHPSYLRHQLTVSISNLSILSSIGDLAFRDPIVITHEGTILDGYARFELAQRQGRPALECIQYELTEPQSLQYLLDKHRRSNGLNDFIRILLALDLESWFTEKARSNQQAGGQHKGSSNLTEAQRIDVRYEIAKVAGVSVGNVSKVKQLLRSAHLEVLQALRSGEIRIHRAWLWSKDPVEKQREVLGGYRSERGVNRKIRYLISRHQPRSTPLIPDLHRLVARLSSLTSDELRSIDLSVIKAQGSVIFISEELLQQLELQGEIALI